MKNTHLLSTVVLGLLMVFAVSCTTMQTPAGSDYEQPAAAANAPSRLYVEDPYNWGRTIVLERDPFTGRYYQVTPYSNRVSAYDSRYYNDRYYNNRYNDRYYRGYPSRSTQPQADQRTSEQKGNDARERILGGKKQ
jgi:hypothetical protein